MVRNPESKHKPKPKPIRTSDGLTVRIEKMDEAKITVVEEPIHRKTNPLGTAIRQNIHQKQQEVEPPVEPEDWEKLHNIHQTCAESLVTMGLTVNSELKNPEVTKHISNVAQFNNLINGLTDDLNAFTKELNGIHDRFLDKKGPIVAYEDLIASLNIHEDYTLWQERFQAITLPVVQEIIRHTEEATQAYYRQQALQQAKAEPESTNDEAAASSDNDGEVQS